MTEIKGVTTIVAKMYPTLKEIRFKNPNLSSEELKFMYLLENNLDDTFNVYLEPFLNGDIPNAIVMNNKGNIFIIEISDMKMDECKYTKYNDKYGQFRNIKNNKILKNPFKQVSKYKNDIFGLHIEQLFMKKERDYRIFGIIKTGVYFTQFTKEKLSEEFRDISKDVSYIELWGKDSDIILSIKSFCNRKNDFMTQELYDEFHRLFKPSFHSFKLGKNVNLTKKQKKMIVSEVNACKKIRGIAGSGKTLVLAHRAIYSNKRTLGKILILTFNITLTNYIKDRLNAVREDFSWNMFVIKHYHGFIFEQASKHNIKVNLSMINFDKSLNNKFKSISQDLDKYDAILIDEGQDFEKHWFDNLKENFLKKNGEFIIFADEKQNIYNREVDMDKNPSTNIIGRWTELNSNSFRLGCDIVDLANKFQFNFFKDKYEISEIENSQQYMLRVQDLLYKYDENITYNEIFDEVVEYIIKNKINNNNVSIVSNKINDIRNLEYYARKKYNLNIEGTFETKEEYDELCAKYKNREVLEHKLLEIARIRKFNFKLNNGKMKMSTIHSFKGWETETLIIIIDEEDENELLTPELIYTAITRCISNLIIYNRGNKTYHSFFNDNMDDLSKYREYAILSKQNI